MKCYEHTPHRMVYGNSLLAGTLFFGALLLVAAALVAFTPSGGKVHLEGGEGVLMHTTPLGRVVNRFPLEMERIESITLEEGLLDRPSRKATGRELTSYNVLLSKTDGEVLPFLRFNLTRSAGASGLFDIKRQLRAYQAEPGGTLSLSHHAHTPPRAMAAIIAAATLYFLLWGAPALRLTADRARNLLRLERRWIWGRRERTWHADQVSHTMLEYKRVKHGHRVRPVLVAQDGGHHPLGSYSHVAEKRYAEMLTRLESMLGIPFRHLQIK